MSVGLLFLFWAQKDWFKTCRLLDRQSNSRKIKGLRWFDPHVGGEGGIRTHGTENRTLDFESSPFDHSGTSPRLGSEYYAF